MSNGSKKKSTITIAAFKDGLDTMLSNAAFVIEFNFNRKGYLEHEKLALLVTEFL